MLPETLHATETEINTGLVGHFTFTSELPFASFSERVLVQNVSHENDLIFMRMNVQVTYIFIPIASHKDSFCHRHKVNLGLGYSSMSCSGSL